MIKVIPAIDIVNGRCVRLTQGDFARATVFRESPLQVAQGYADAGFSLIHFIDLDGAKAGRVEQMDVLRWIVDGTGLDVQFGGGLRSDDDVKAAFDAGAARVVVGSAAVNRPESVVEWIARYGAERVVVAADFEDGLVRVDAWRDDTSRHVLALLSEFARSGLHWALATDIEKDGKLAGPAVDFYRGLKSELPQLGVIASGGVRGVSDVRALDAAGADAVVVGKALLGGYIEIDELKEFA